MRITNKKRAAIVHFDISLFIKRIMVLTLLGIVQIPGKTSNDLILKAIILPGAPKILKDKRIIYGLDLVFGNTPKDYWVYYSRIEKKLVIDFYGVHIKGKPKVELSGRGVFKDYKIINSKTKLSLSKKHARVLIRVEPDPEWHFKSKIINGRIVRIFAWKDIVSLTKIDKKKRKVWPIILLGTLALSAIIIPVVIINQRDQ